MLSHHAALCPEGKILNANQPYLFGIALFIPPSLLQALIGAQACDLSPSTCLIQVGKLVRSALVKNAARA